MINVVVPEFKIKLGGSEDIEGTEYTFRLDFRALKKFDERYESALQIFNDFLSNKKVYDCIVKILSCACVEKEFTEEELEIELGFNFEVMKFMDEITMALVKGVVLDKKETKGDKKAKN